MRKFTAFSKLTEELSNIAATVLAIFDPRALLLLCVIMDEKGASSGVEDVVLARYLKFGQSPLSNGGGQRDLSC